MFQEIRNRQFRILFNMSQNFIRFVKNKTVILHVYILLHKKMQRDILHRQVELKN